MSMMRIVTALALLAASALAYTVPPNSTRTTANGTTITTGATAVEVTEHTGWDSITGDGAEITCPGTAHVDGDNNEVNLEDYSLVVVQGDNNDVNLTRIIHESRGSGRSILPISASLLLAGSVGASFVVAP